MGKIKTPHDNFVRAILADKEIAIEYFKNYLPAFVSSQLDFSTLTQLSDTYLSKSLRKTMSDIIYSCGKNNGADSVKVSILIEHKSYPDKFTPIQMGNYIFSGFDKQIFNKEKLSLIIPILFYHGAEKWEYRELPDLFENVDQQWKQFIPHFSYIYHNLGEMSDEHLGMLSNQFLAASLLTLKHFKESNWLEENATRIFTRTVGAPENLLELLIVYFFEISKSDEPKIIEILESVPDTIKNKIMSTLDIFFEKGRIEGSDKTLFRNAKNMLVKGFAVNVICEVLEVTPDFIEKVRLELNASASE